MATDRWGIPIGWVAAGANRNDSILLEPTPQAVADRGLPADVETLHLDRGYDSNPTLTRCADLGLHDVLVAKKKPRGKATPTKAAQPAAKPANANRGTALSLGLRWPVEGTNSWFSNFGQLRRNPDRHPDQRLAQIALAVTLILILKLITWAKRWNN